MTTDKQQTKDTNPTSISKPIVFFHGDKGGVGKSWTCAVFTDYLISTALVDGDARNPDVSRMFDTSIPIFNTNLREHTGWMDLIDFMMKHHDKLIVISMPAGIGNEFKKELPHFAQNIRLMNRSVSMFWVITHQSEI
jgi:Mrp family chromosome partitioning ATPase